MRKVGLFEPKHAFPLHRNPFGLADYITITRRGKPVARLVPVNRVSTSDYSRLVLRMDKLKARISTKSGSFSPNEILSARDAGRR